MSGDLEDMRTYSRGYEDGRRSKDADHADVALRLSRLTFDGGSHENLSKIAYAIYPCATGWTCESAKGLRDRLIDLLGGVHEHRCDSGRGCACGNRDSGDSGEPVEAMTYDVLGNERHKAVCELRKMPDAYKGKKPTRRWYMELCDAIGIGYATTFANVRDRLIHLLGGDEPDLQKSPIFEDSGNDDAGEITITDELRKFATDPLLGYASQEQHVERITAIADRIDEKFGHIYHQQGAVLQSAISHLVEECNKLHAECDRLTAALDELHADPANDVICRLERERSKEHAKVLRLEFENAEWRRGAERDADKLESLTGAYNDAVAERDDLRAKLEEADAAIANWREREMSFDESERLREKLQDEMKELQDELKELEEFEPDIAMTAYGDDNDELRRLLYRAAKLLANAEQERDANYAYWMDCKEKVVQANVTIDELQDKLDAIREALDGNH